MPTIESIDLSARLEELAALLLLQRAEPTLTAFDAVDLRLAGREIERLRNEVEELRAENRRLRGVILEETAKVETLERVAKQMADRAVELELREDSREWNESDWRD